ncbi:DsbA family protein [bacterium]|nr:DsbA family protein [bacterium]
MFKDKFMLGIITITVVVMFGGVWFVSRLFNDPASSSNGSIPVSEDKKQLLEVVSDDHIKGNKEASVTLVEYLDFECEACRAYYPMVKQLAEEFNDDIRVVNRYFPLPGHKNSMTAALAVEAASRQGKYWEMHDKLYEEQINWGERKSADPTIFENYAKDIGLNMEQYKNDLTDKELKSRVNRDKNSGTRLGVSGTPTFFLNGEKIPNPKSAEDFRNFIIAAISKSPTSSTSEPVNTDSADQESIKQ